MRDYQEEELPVVMTDVTWKPDNVPVLPQRVENEPSALVRFANSLRSHTPIDEALPAEKLFPLTNFILHMSDGTFPLQTEGISITMLQEEQCRAFVARVGNLAKQITAHLIEMGTLFVRGQQACLFQFVGASSMYDWMVNGNHVSKDMYNEAVERFYLYCFVEPFNIKPSELANLDSYKMKHLRRMRDDLQRQTQNLAKQHVIEYLESQDGGEAIANACRQIDDFNKIMEQVPADAREEVRSAATGATQALITAGIRHLLQSDTDDLKREDAQVGEAVQPVFPMHVHYNPFTGELSYTGSLFIEPGHIEAMKKSGSHLVFYPISPVDADTPNGPITLQQLAEWLDKHQEE